MGRGISGGNSQAEPLKKKKREGGGGGLNRKEKRGFWLWSSTLDTVAWRIDVIWGPENNVSELKKPGYCRKGSVGPLPAAPFTVAEPV